MRLLKIAVGLVTVLALPLLYADTATIYQNVPNPGNAADPANQSTLLPYATFTITNGGINYDSNLTGYSVASFLNNPTFTGHNGFDSSIGINNSEIVIQSSGFLKSGANSFVVAHDDGVVLTFLDPAIGLVVNEPGPTAPVSTPFIVNNPGPGGNYSFVLEYTECCGPPAELVFTINNAPVGNTVPEPSSITLIAPGVLGLVNLLRRRYLS